MIQLIMQSTTSGHIHDISQLVTDLSLETVRMGKATQLTLTLVWDKDLAIDEGSILCFKKDDYPLFYGYIFKVNRSSDATLSITAYDQIRYLLNKETYVFKNKKAHEIVRSIARDFDLTLGTIEETVYPIPLMVEDGQTLLDIIYKALDQTLLNTGEMYTLYDDFGKLTLKKVTSMFTDLIIGDHSLLTDYSYDRSIDGDTYNKIKLYKDNKETGKRDIYMAKDSRNIGRWGLLQYYEKVNEKMNDAQIRNRAKQLELVKNRVVKGLSLECIGDLRIRGGSSIYVDISGLDLKNRFLVESAKHNFSKHQHTMSLTLKVI